MEPDHKEEALARDGVWALAEQAKRRDAGKAKGKDRGKEKDVAKVKEKVAAKSKVVEIVSKHLFKKGRFIMPGGDRTGPSGMGPMTGRGAGRCAGLPVPGYANTGGGRGFGSGGFGRGGGGRGRRNQFYATGLTGWQRAAAVQPMQAASEENELDLLKQQAQIMEQQMKQLHERISQLETKD